MPILGICLGEQLMNVYRGGSLIQFLPDLHRENALEHRSMGDPTRRHLVRIVPGTMLAEASGQRQITVNTRHKQAVGRVGRGLRVNSRSPPTASSRVSKTPPCRCSSASNGIPKT